MTAPSNLPRKARRNPPDPESAAQTAADGTRKAAAKAVRKRADTAVATPPGKPSAKPTGERIREPRGLRRRRETRTRLLEAALSLMATRGMEGVAINEITEAADVGFGSFYNHFESKEAIYEALVEQVFETFGEALDRLVKDVQDPAETIALCVRHTVLRAQREPLWGNFLLREGYSTRSLNRGLGPRLLRDMLRGIGSGRFKLADPMMSFVAVGGTVLAAVAAELQISTVDGPQQKLAISIGLPTDDIPQRTALILLTILGLPPEEAKVIAYKPLPTVNAA